MYISDPHADNVATSSQTTMATRALAKLHTQTMS